MQRLRRILQLTVALTVTAFLLLYVVDVREVVRTVRQFDGAWILPTLALITFDRALMSFKWGLLLRVRGHRLPFVRGMMVYCSAMVWGLALPSTVGADAIRAYLARRQGVDYIDSIATIAVERAIGFLIALAMGLVSLLLVQRLLPPTPVYEAALLLVGGAMIVGIAVVALSFTERAFETLRGLLPVRWQRHRVVAKLESLHEAYRSLGADRRTLLAFTSLTVLQQALSILVLWLIARTLSIELNLLHLLASAPLAFLFARLPISVDGIGVYEAIFVATMSLWGVHPAQSFAISMVGRLFHLVTWLPWFVAHAVRSHTGRPDVTEGTPIATK